MYAFVFLLAFALASSNEALAYSSLNFKATFGSNPAPFKIDVDPSFIGETKLKASLTRSVLNIDAPAWFDGPPAQNVSSVRDYWTNNYDWFAIQDQLNENLTQFTTTVYANNTKFTDPIPLHFVHHRSPRPDAIPLLFLHGYPGSFLEVATIINGLTHPSSNATPAFHVVAPSIPGFGFSPAPTSPGLNLRVAGAAYNSLMLQLNYTKYVIQGGDLGAITSHFIAGDFPQNVVSLHSNFWLTFPNATDFERYQSGTTTNDENTTITNLATFEHNLSGFTHIQESMPGEVAVALGDSPVGYAMWIYVLMYYGVDQYSWSPEEIITWAMMHYIQGPFGAIRSYKESAEEGIDLGFTYGDIPFLPNPFPYVSQPVAISEFPKDFWFGTPLDWAQRTGNVVERYIHDHGGHFAALERPLDMLNDIRLFFGNKTLSGTAVFETLV